MNLGVKNLLSRNWRKRIDQLDHDWPNALRDVDGEPVICPDERPLYEPGATIDNPVVQTRYFATVSEMLEFERPWMVDRAVTLNRENDDGEMNGWTMIASPALTEQPPNILEAFEGYGMFVRTDAGQGSQGPAGPPGEPGGSTLITHIQSVPDTKWTIVHNQGVYPEVTIRIGGFEVGAEVQFPDINTVVINLNSMQVGEVDLRF